jgi:hypothetical protein
MLKSNIQIAVEAFVPTKTVVDGASKPWFNNSMYRSLKKKVAAYQKAKADPTPENWEAYREARNQHNHAVRARKREHASEVAERIESRSGRPWWRLIDSVLGRNAKSSRLPALDCGSDVIDTPSEKANYLNKMFVRKSRVKDDNQLSPALASQCQAEMKKIIFRRQVVQKLLQSIDASKAPGLDGVTGVVLKRCAASLSVPITRLFQLSYTSGSVPSEWKTSKVIPVHKKNSKADPGNYRPVALLSIISKVMERYVAIASSSISHSKGSCRTTSLASVLGTAPFTHCSYYTICLRRFWTSN